MIVSKADDSRVRRALEQFRESPGKALRRAIALLNAVRVLRHCEHGIRTAVFGPLLVRNEGRVRIGSGVTFVGGMLPTEIACRPGATIEIGDDSTFNYAVSLEAHASIRIGRRCMLASHVRVCDRGRDGTAPVTIGDDVWIAHGAIIEPGVTIGDGSVVAAGSVVMHDVPAGSIAAGNPARSMGLALAGGEQAAARRA